MREGESKKERKSAGTEERGVNVTYLTENLVLLTELPRDPIIVWCGRPTWHLVLFLFILGLYILE